MKKKSTSIFTTISFLVFTLILVLGIVFIIITYISATHFYQATTQRLNKDVAAHIARFTSPFDSAGFNKKVADSVFYDAMVLSPNVEVYFLDTSGNVMYFQAPDTAIKLRKIPLENIKKHIESQGLDYIKGPDPKNPDADQVFSAAEVKNQSGKLGYIYVILGSNEYRKVSNLFFENHVVMLTVETFAIVIILSLVLSLLYLNRVKKNFKKITAVLSLHKQGNYQARLQMDNYNEFSSIADGFNNMADLLVYNIERLEQTAKERKDFIANVSHDLRTPLSIARGYIETLQHEIKKVPPNKEAQEEFVKMAFKKIHHLEIMVKQLFELSKMESVEFKPVKEPFIISDIVEETVNTAQKNAAEKNIHLTCTGCQDSYWINADISMMERVIQNLIDNAIKYTPECGSIHVVLSRTGDELKAIIENSGAPLSTQLLEWINADKASKEAIKKPHGGLGLAIVLKILQLHQYGFNASITNNGFNRFIITMKLYSGL